MGRLEGQGSRGNLQYAREGFLSLASDGSTHVTGQSLDARRSGRADRLKRRIAGVLWFALVGFSPALHVHGEDRIVVPFSPLPPWKFVDQKGFSGAYAELAREIAARMNMAIDFVQCPLKRCLRFMETGEANLIVGVNGTADRRIYIRFLETPYRISSAKVFYVKRDAGKRIQDYTDLYGSTIGTKLGAKYFPRFDRDSRIRKVEAKTNPQIFEMLDRDRTDAVIIAEDQGEYWISRLGYRDRFEKAAFFYRDKSPRSVGISRRSSLIRSFDAIEAVMRRLVKDGKLKDIYREHYFERFNIPMDSRTTDGGNWFSDLFPKEP